MKQLFSCAGGQVPIFFYFILFFQGFPILSYFSEKFLFFPIFVGFVQSCHIYFLYKVELCAILVCFLFQMYIFQIFF